MTAEVELEIEKLFDDFKKKVSCDLVEAFDLYLKIFKLSTEHNVDLSKCEETASMLGTHLNSSTSPFCQSVMMEKIVELDAAPKLFLCRYLSQTVITGMSMESILAVTGAENQKWKDKSFLRRFIKKVPLPYAMVYGTNIMNRLGTKETVTAKFQKFKLDGLIKEVYIGNYHSIIVMSNWKYYGLGKVSNFLENPNESEHEVCQEPILLSYMEGIAERLKEKDELCKLTDCSTEFHDFKAEHILIVGNGKFEVKQTPQTEPEKSDEIPIVIHDNPIKAHISPKDHTFRMDNSQQKHPINFFFCANRAMPDKNTKAKYCENGVVWMNHSGTLYRGQLEWAPIDGLRNGDMKEVLVGMMNEVVLEYKIDSFSISPDGAAIMIYNEQISEQNQSYLSICNPRMTKLTSSMNKNPYVIPFDTTFTQFKEMLESNWKNEQYEYSGLPSKYGEICIPYIEKIREFIKCEEGSNSPIHFEKMYKECKNDTSIINRLEALYSLFFDKSEVYKPIVVNAGWDEEERDERKLQISTKFRESISSLLKNIEAVLTSLTNLPIVYHQTHLIAYFKLRIAMCMKFCMKKYTEAKESRDSHRSAVKVMEVKGLPNGEKSLGDLIKERIEKGDIEKGDEAFKCIRVEAIVLMKGCNSTTQQPYVCFTSREHIQVIDRTLLDHIENGVLNLNAFAYSFLANTPSQVNSKFTRVLDMFFLHSEDRLATVSFMNGSERLFPSTALYTINTSNGTALIPKHFIQAHSDGFDVARRRNAEREGKNPDVIELMDSTKQVVARLLYSMIDARLLKKETVSDLYEVLEICQYWIIAEPQVKMVKMIVERAQKTDYEVIHKLFSTHPEETVLAIKKRPDMLAYWVNFPVPGNYLYTKAFERLITNIISPYDRQLVTPLPRVASKKSDVKIDPKWLEEKMLQNQKDDHLKKDFQRAVIRWQGNSAVGERRVSKRLHGD